MKWSVIPRAAASLVFCLHPLCQAQDLLTARAANPLTAEPGDDSLDRPPAHKAFHARLGSQPISPLRADSIPRDAESAFLLQDETTLRSLTSPPRSLESVADLAALREASPYRTIAPTPLNLNIIPALVPPPTLPPRVTDPDP